MATVRVAQAPVPGKRRAEEAIGNLLIPAHEQLVEALKQELEYPAQPVTATPCSLYKTPGPFPVPQECMEGHSQVWGCTRSSAIQTHGLMAGNPGEWQAQAAAAGRAPHVQDT